MKAITLTQPWATLVAIGAKQTETRSWSTRYRGPLAIHAAKGWTPEVVRTAMTEPYKRVLAEAGYKLFSHLPRAVIVATCTLTDCVPTSKFQGVDMLDFAFGDFTHGRWAWILKDVNRLEKPIPARGALSLWEQWIDAWEKEHPGSQYLVKRNGKLVSHEQLQLV
jgi:hypothetical protein